MSTGRFDDLARALAAPMPRRRALRLGVGVVLAGAFPSLRPSTARSDVQDCAGRNELCPTPGHINCGHSIAGQTGACCCYCCATAEECGGGGGAYGFFCCAPERRCADTCCPEGEVCKNAQCVPPTPCVDDAFHRCMDNAIANYERQEGKGCGGTAGGCQDAIFLLVGTLIGTKIQQSACRKQANKRCGPCETCDFKSGNCASLCSGSASCCSGNCTDLKHDSNNCGSCGRVCVAPSTCTDGHCV
jgi:hypothetical protein